MQKIIVIIIFIVMAAFSANAQVTAAKKPLHSVTDTVAAAMCSCIMINKDSLTTLNLFYAALDSCLKNNSVPKMEELLKEAGFVQTDDRKERAAAIRVVGRKIGQKVANECSGFKAILNNLMTKEIKPELH